MACSIAFLASQPMSRNDFVLTSVLHPQQHTCTCAAEQLIRYTVLPANNHHIIKSWAKQLPLGLICSGKSNNGFCWIAVLGKSHSRTFKMHRQHLHCSFSFSNTVSPIQTFSELCDCLKIWMPVACKLGNIFFNLMYIYKQFPFWTCAYIGQTAPCHNTAPYSECHVIKKKKFSGVIFTKFMQYRW